MDATDFLRHSTTQDEHFFESEPSRLRISMPPLRVWRSRLKPPDLLLRGFQDPFLFPLVNGVHRILLTFYQLDQFVGTDRAWLTRIERVGNLAKKCWQYRLDQRHGYQLDDRPKENKWDHGEAHFISFVRCVWCHLHFPPQQVLTGRSKRLAYSRP